MSACNIRLRRVCWVWPSRNTLGCDGYVRHAGYATFDILGMSGTSGMAPSKYLVCRLCRAWSLRNTQVWRVYLCSKPYKYRTWYLLYHNDLWKVAATTSPPPVLCAWNVCSSADKTLDGRPSLTSERQRLAVHMNKMNLHCRNYPRLHNPSKVYRTPLHGNRTRQVDPTSWFQECLKEKSPR